MTTAYDSNFSQGMSDRASGFKCICPDTIPDMMAYRGYMDGWSGRQFDEPKGMPVKQVFKNHAEGGNLVNSFNNFFNGVKREGIFEKNS